MADYLKIPEIARRLDVSEKTVRRYIKAGTLPSTFIGGAYRVTEEDLEEFIHRAEVKPEAPKVESRASLEPTFNHVLEDERRLEEEAALAVLFRGLARRARLIVERSRKEGPSAELGEELSALHYEAAALYRIRGRRDIFGSASEELIEAEDAYQEAESVIQAMLRQDIEATDEERAVARRFKPGDAGGRREADAS